MSNNNGNSSGKSSAGDAKAPQGSSTNASSGRRASSGSGTQAPSAYRIINDGWGSRSNFQHSYGLDMSPEGLEEGNQIIEAFQEYDQQASQRRSSN
ncbi:unnamed protein product [Parascedosporium putredinis]|uniref:Uncharacterized protein n=1 Tax=Parascedosporium putredinis TaxID=1442378 RepID=A0A9P1GZL7_9PEZI|nr:unnamed protein product [Parascedosporium putredinis]CAI7991896.1 unnamed protein product [Parascedosporium putredinis]